MRRWITAGTAAALLVFGGGGATLAQDDTGGGDLPDKRVEIPDAGLSIAVPNDWKADLRRDRSEVVLPAGYEDASPAVGWSVLLVSMPGTEGFCGLTMFEDLPMGLEEWVRFRAPDGSGVIVASVELPIGEAIRMMDDPDIEHDVAIFLNGTTYAFVTNGTLYTFGCLSAAPSDDLWLSLAETIAPLDLEPHPLDEPVAIPAPVVDLTRVLIPQTGLTVSFPEGWSIETMNRAGTFRIPSNFGDGQPVTTLTVLSARSDGGSECIAMLYEDVPMSVMDHAMWMAMEHSDPQAGFGATSTPVELPVGDARRVDLMSPESGTFFRYLLDAAGGRVQLTCNDPEDPPEDDFLSIAETIEVEGAEPIVPRPVDAPALPTIASVDAVSGFSSVVEVADGLLMSADCELALWAAYEDGTFREWLSCWLSPEPVADPAEQGTWPDEFVSTSGDACTWVSDYWAVSDGSEVWADDYELSVTPEGRVFGSSSYGPELLDCSDG